ncbi:MAG: DUF3025 domain-containing protein [Betaproteobacteria bacterium]|nr:MAG: DUF3025 domain-containing protein [Betaproteobacteria bacterium]
MSAAEVACAPAAFAQRPLFEPIARLLAACEGPGLPDANRLSALLHRVAPGVVSGAGRPIRFVVPTADAVDYEARIHATGEVPTRPDDWHDFFNALAWCAWPRSKAACNARHIEEQGVRARAGLPGRGPRRDALTQFDECGMVVACADADIAALLAAHAWEEAFWHRRARLLQTTRFMVFGHGTWDQLRAPFFGLCAKVLYRVIEPAWLALPIAGRQAETDAWLSGRLADPAFLATPRDLSPLPLLGIPGVTSASEGADYYRDTRQFRPPRNRPAAEPGAID